MIFSSREPLVSVKCLTLNLALGRKTIRHGTVLNGVKVKEEREREINNKIANLAS